MADRGYTQACHSSLCDYQEPHRHGFACGKGCPCGMSMQKGTDDD